MKIFKHKNFMGLIYSILVSLPFLSVLATCVYISFNKNAYMSYESTLGTMSNAFELSLGRFIANNNTGYLNLFTWFSTLFLDYSNSVNALYIDFINWYMNYTLLVSISFVLFLVIMWFITFVRRLLEKSMNFDL